MIFKRKEGDYMITLEEIGNFISNQGFPIACAAWLFYQQSRQNKYNEQRDKQMIKAISQNTQAIKSLESKIK